MIYQSLGTELRQEKKFNNANRITAIQLDHKTDQEDFFFRLLDGLFELKIGTDMLSLNGRN
jgi:hypothetical protein